MSEQVRILSFYENWVDIMEMCNPEEWYELSTIITNLRFKNIDTDPKTLTNIKVKMAWAAIRPSIKKSNRNSRYQENKAKKNTDITPNEEYNSTTELSATNNDFQKNDFKAYTSHVNDIDDTNYHNTIESASEAKEMGNTGILQDTEIIGTIENKQFEVMKGKTTIEIEEQDLTNEEIVKRASNDFVNHYKIDAYNLWVELNDSHRNGESYQNLWKKWVDMWRPFICTDRRIELQGEITDAACQRYYKRYKKEMI